MTELMTGKERVKAALSHQETDRPPVAYFGAEPELAAQLHNYYGVPDELSLWLKLGLDFWPIDFPKTSGPEKSRQEQWADTKQNPLQQAQTVSEVELYFRKSMPTYDIDYVKFAADKCKEHLEKVRFIFGGSLFESAYHARGFSALLEDFYVNPVLADAIIEHFSQSNLEKTSRVLQAFQGSLDMVFVSDDLGTQRGLIFSVDLFRRFFKPRLRKIIELAHRHGAVVGMHSCGSVVELIPELIEVGLDILNPIQISAEGMDPKRLKSEFGRHLSFWGGVDIQTVLREQTPQQIRDTVRYLIRTLGKDGGYICAPTHVVMNDTPLDHVIAFFESCLHQ